MARQTDKLIVRIAPDQTSGVSQLVSLNQRVHQGLIFFIKAKIPNYANNVTTTLSILDKEGDVIYKISDLARNATHIISDIQVPLVEKETVKLTLSGIPGGTSEWTNEVILYYLSDF